MSHYISTNRSKHYLKCHLILVTKYRRNILVGQLTARFINSLHLPITQVKTRQKHNFSVMFAKINLF